MYIAPTTCARYAYGVGVNTIRTGELRRGRKLMGVALHYEGDKAKLAAANIIHTTAHHRYAPELVEQVAVFVTREEAKKRGLL